MDEKIPSTLVAKLLDLKTIKLNLTMKLLHKADLYFKW